MINIILYIREFDLSDEIELNKNADCVNINRNREIYNLLRKHLAKITKVRIFII
jgi:hypothetical protein